MNGAGNSHHIHSSAVRPPPPQAATEPPPPACVHGQVEANTSAQRPSELKWTFWILVSLESCGFQRGRQCPPFLIEKTDCACLSWPVLCPFWLWWDRLPGRHLSLCRDLFLQDSRVFTQTYTNGARSKEQALPGPTITLMLVGLTFGNWGSHHVLTWNYPEPWARSLSKWDTGP